MSGLRVLDGTAELLAEGVGVELLNVHYGSKILAGEPTLAVSAIGFSYVAGVYSRIVLQPFTVADLGVEAQADFQSFIFLDEREQVKRHLFVAARYT